METYGSIREDQNGTQQIPTYQMNFVPLIWFSIYLNNEFLS